MYEYIDNKNQIKDQDQATMKCKGIPKKCLNHEMYKNYDENNKSCEVKFSGLRKKHINLTKHDKEINLQHFSIVNNTQTRTFMKSEWKGMTLKDNLYYPKGFIF
jgi:hypothetical protein